MHSLHSIVGHSIFSTTGLYVALGVCCGIFNALLLEHIDRIPSACNVRVPLLTAFVALVCSVWPLRLWALTIQVGCLTRQSACKGKEPLWGWTRGRRSAYSSSQECTPIGRFSNRSAPFAPETLMRLKLLFLAEFPSNIGLYKIFWNGLKILPAGPHSLLSSCPLKMTWVPNELTEFDLVLFGFLHRISCPKG